MKNHKNNIENHKIAQLCCKTLRRFAHDILWFIETIEKFLRYLDKSNGHKSIESQFNEKHFWGQRFSVENYITEFRLHFYRVKKMLQKNKRIRRSKILNCLNIVVVFHWSWNYYRQSHKIYIHNSCKLWIKLLSRTSVWKCIKKRHEFRIFITVIWYFTTMNVFIYISVHDNAFIFK